MHQGMDEKERERVSFAHVHTHTHTHLYSQDFFTFSLLEQLDQEVVSDN